jgi:hypothetical protein
VAEADVGADEGEVVLRDHRLEPGAGLAETLEGLLELTLLELDPGDRCRAYPSYSRLPAVRAMSRLFSASSTAR